MSPPFAFVTLLTSDSYLPGALALAAALKDVHPSPPIHPEVEFDTVCLVTPESVDVTTIKLLRRAFGVVVGVELIAQEDETGLNLLGRPDLNAVLTKLHVFRLTQYSKLIFLDADVLPVRPLSHLFHIEHPFSAVPDVGWPDIFNSGVMVLSPGEDKFNEVRRLLATKGSWDGGDQGILNEWRGVDWNRLSFTYNTTPSAAYTYAPAYERFGSQISALHFIGPNKPWISIPYRAPGVSTNSQPQVPSQTEQPSTTSTVRAYDYNSLVDRWYATYDSHYRVQSLVPDSEFEIKKYVSAWDEDSAASTELAASNISIGGALGLEDLRRIALSGMSGIGSGSISGWQGRGGNGEGEYWSMPLDGRVDLMRPRCEEESEAEEGDELSQSKTPTQARGNEGDDVRQYTLPPPALDEVPVTPSLGGHSLPSATVPPPQWRQHHDHDSDPNVTPNHQSQDTRTHPEQQQQTRHLRAQERPRNASPPLLSWNPSVEPPPNTTPSAQAFPSDTYFPNVWDQSHRRHQHPPSQKINSDPSNPLTDLNTWFHIPPPPEIPQQLLQQGHYKNLWDDTSVAPAPDRSKIKQVFPWEGKLRHAPGRVFPGSDSPPPGAPFLELPKVEEAPPTQPPTSPERRQSPTPGRPAPPNIGLPKVNYSNAWDTVPQITKYANRLAKPIQPSSPLAFNDLDYKKSRGWDAVEASSHDGDDEDESDDEGDEGPTPNGNGWTRNVPTSPDQAISKGKYRTQGVQTIPKSTRNFGVQVTATDEAVETKRSMRGKRSRTSSIGSGPLLIPPVNVPSARPSVTDPDQMGIATPVLDQPFRHTTSFLAAPPFYGARSPREVTSPPQVPSHSPSPPRRASIIAPRPILPLLPVLRTISSETNTSLTSLASPPSSTGPVSPQDGYPIALPVKKVGRVWDPARGIELFKRSSEEVLARFLKMGSFDDDTASAQQHRP